MKNLRMPIAARWTRHADVLHGLSDNYFGLSKSHRLTKAQFTSLHVVGRLLPRRHHPRLWYHRAGRANCAREID